MKVTGTLHASDVARIEVLEVKRLLLTAGLRAGAKLRITEPGRRPKIMWLAVGDALDLQLTLTLEDGS